jgi:serine phosphatase RsbU (regulator of sigma subunit)
MESAPAHELSRDTRSLRRRFSYAFIGVVTLLLFAFAAIAIFLNISQAGADLQKRLDNALQLSMISLPTPLWNLDNAVVHDFIEALFLDEAMVLAEVSWGTDSTITHKHPQFRQKGASDFADSAQFLVKSSDILYEQNKVGTIRLVMSRQSIQRELLFNIAGIVALTIVLIAAIACTSILITRRYITQPLSQLQRSAALIAHGDLDATIAVDRQDEIGLLASDLNTMRAAIQRLFGEVQRSNAQLEEANHTLEARVEERTVQLATANAEITALNKRLEAENLRLGAELDVTRKIQQMLLPTAEELRQVEALDIACYMAPATEVGGDYYDVLSYNGQIKIGIGDVTGHGLESGVVMVMTQAIVRALLTSGEADPVRFLSTLNRTLYGNVQRMGTDKNLTLALIDYAAGEVRLSGQHEAMIVMRCDGTLELVDTVDLGFPIGLIDEVADLIAQTTVALQPGDGVVLYTDGITEAANLDDEQYGLERLCAVVQAHWSEPAEAIKEAVVQDVRRHIGAQEVYDDITLVVLKQL